MADQLSDKEGTSRAYSHIRNALRWLDKDENRSLYGKTASIMLACAEDNIRRPESPEDGSPVEYKLITLYNITITRIMSVITPDVSMSG